MKYILYITLFSAGMVHAASRLPHDDSDYAEMPLPDAAIRYSVENRPLDRANEYDSRLWQSMVAYATKKKPLSQLTEGDWLEARAAAEAKLQDEWMDGLLNELSSDDELSDD